MRYLRSRTADALAVLALAAYAAALLRKTLLGGGAMLGYDLFNYFFPAKTFAAAALAHGQLPLWNPDIYFGAPFLANVQMAVLYPPDLLFNVFSFPRAVAVSQWLHLVVGATGMYALGRWGWGLGPLPSLIGGLTFEGSGFFAAHMGHLNQVHAAAWLPWIGLCAQRVAALGVQSAKCKVQSGGTGGARLRSGGGSSFYRSHSGIATIADFGRRTLRQAQGRLSDFGPGLGWLLGGGVAVALLLTAGHTQEAYYSLFGLGLLAAGFTIFPPARAPRRAWHLLGFAAICLNGVSLAAAQLLPAYELSRLSYRQSGIPLAEAVAYGVERMNILETVLPTFWSLPSQEVTGYVGVAALVLAVAALGASPARRTVLALAALGLLALILTLGTYTPLYAQLHRFFPLFNSFRAPGRWVLVSTFALAGLAAHGADALSWRPCAAVREQRARRFGFALTAGVAALALFAWRSEIVHAVQWLPQSRTAVLWLLAGAGALALGLSGLFSRLPWPQVALAGVIALELGFAAHEAEYNQPGEPALYLQPPAIATYLAAVTSTSAAEPPMPERVVSLAVEERLDAGRLVRAVPDGDASYKHYASMREALKPNLGMVYGLPTIDGYDGGLLPTRDYARFKALLVTREAPVPHLTLPPQVDGAADAKLLAALGVRYLLTDGRNGAPGEGWDLREAAPGASWTYENALPASRLLFPARVMTETDPEAGLSALAGAGLSQMAVLDRPVDGLPAAGAAGATPPRRQAAVLDYGAHDVELAADVDRPSLLVFADSYYPGWRASVDGRDVSLVRADLLFRGLVVPEGRHRVRFWFDPLSVKLGVAVSLGAVVANAAAFLLWSRFTRVVPRPTFHEAVST